jgi:hypothetical protein
LRIVHLEQAGVPTDTVIVQIVDLSAGSRFQSYVNPMNLTDFYARTPVNKTAATVISTGTHFIPNKKQNNNDSELPLAIKRLNDSDLAQKDFQDLTGRTVGRFTVQGLSLDSPRHWVVRCVCGRYSTRRAKAIKNPANSQDRCEHCRHLASLQRSEIYRRTGKNADIRDF